ncbi:tRNA (adenosine(37)-N6)-threonylcarbamoyltransferase complex ATPase subunit type 1 TsaE [Gemmobacter nanjingensis]|uniref:tRNA threonylcarbamoyladenosine biosynthesis protein TsaE n=1 Tax=Gemmobacter nanjingensis TaxID=488454 RepID=A0ABQ3FMX1_9RHOB|nr:tRNA (adenosine(37)-N6)-threonylcarbamoyltransferase complex ATPase subunit type 1 TsaE [Gemmobacter nanjingensis]GHC29689.1 tRNA (adenosine(37)-N6)-threonylcarbamoyltransferase complex ATPase subunit type 1 TsaE [Gemmobacter nanjingensis]
MNSHPPLTLFLPDDTATDRLARRFATLAQPGMTLLLEGGIGAGKTHFSRAFIRQRLGAEVDVPSPTYTLVQTYEDPRGDICHADLYRLGHPDEVAELGLISAFETAICLVEWPDRLGNQTPPDALRIAFRPEGEGRLAVLDFGKRDDLRGAFMALDA